MTLLLLASAPVFIIIIFIYLKDKYEKEPKKLLLKAFLFGAIFSIITTMIISGVAIRVFPMTNGFSVAQQFIKAFIVVGIS